MRLDHYNIAAPMDLLTRVRDFYVDVLAFEEGFRPGFSRPGFWLYSEDRPFIHLIESDRDADSDAPSYLDHVAFRADNLAVVLERLEAHRVAYRRSHIAELGMTQLFFRDPAGTRVEISFLEKTG